MDRVPLTYEEKEMERYGFNMRDDDLGEKISCDCGWEGYRGELVSHLNMKEDVEYMFCPECGREW
ncbi:hypothetical protein K9N50_11345 [bacterium]|nr:hypothetical protein [bacterium]